MFAKDRDLVVLDPAVFRDAAWAGQVSASGEGTVSGTTLSAPGLDFEAAGVEAGGVVVIGAGVYEIVSRDSATALTVSRMRAAESGPTLPPSVSGAVSFSVVGFGAQIADTHRRLLRMLGVGEDGTGASVEASAILNGADLVRLESLGALHVIWAGVSAAGGPESVEGKRAEMFRVRFDAERRVASAVIDTDGDGVGDTRRRFGVIGVVRA